MSSKRGKKGRRGKKSKAAAAQLARERNAERARAERQSATSERQVIRAEMDTGPQAAWGTSASELGRVKAESEEARHVTCLECGYSAGRHSRRCPRASA